MEICIMLIIHIRFEPHFAPNTSKMLATDWKKHAHISYLDTASREWDNLIVLIHVFAHIGRTLIGVATKYKCDSTPGLQYT